MGLDQSGGEAAKIMDSIHSNSNGKQPTPEQIERLIAAIERFERKCDEFFGSYLNAKFPYGKPVDRWSRRA